MRAARGLVIGGALLVLAGVMSTPKLLFGSDHQRAKELLEQACVGCHRLQGTAESRFNLRAPDLIWAGSKYQRPWLIRWLTGKEAPLYTKGYRWDLSEGAMKHPVVSEADANAIAEYFEQNNKDPRVNVGAFDVSKVSKFDVTFGGMAYKAHACLGCHTIEENGTLIGGPQSIALQNAGQRYNLDWLYRFGQNPQDFIVHTGEFLADATDPQLRAVIGYLAAQGVKDFTYYEPWTSQEFAHASVDRGTRLYKEYCAQCHGFTGKGDGPAASGLQPKPAIHANIPFEKLPMDYLYNVINHGGAAMGKSPSMPYWNLTIGQQGVADVIAYLKATFEGAGHGRCAERRPGRRLHATSKDRQGAGRLPLNDESASRLNRNNPCRQDAVPQDRTACRLRHVPWRAGGWEGVHGRRARAAAAQLHMRPDDEGHTGRSAVLDHQERLARDRHDVVRGIAGRSGLATDSLHQNARSIGTTRKNAWRVSLFQAAGERTTRQCNASLHGGKDGECAGA